MAKPPAGSRNRSATPEEASAGAPPRRRLKMKELEEETGVGRETIRFYIKEGLLPQPERPARNVAWYDESFVERILVIKELQEKRFLPLSVIRLMMREGDRPTRAEVDTLLELDGKLFPDDPAGSPDAEPVAAAATRLGLPVAEIRTFADSGAVSIQSRDGEDRLEGPGIQVLEAWARLRAAGFSPENGFPTELVELYMSTVRALAREELRVFSRAAAGQLHGDSLVQMGELGIDLVGEIIALLRKQTLLQFIHEGNIPSEP